MKRILMLLILSSVTVAVVRFYYARPWDPDNSLAEEHIDDITVADNLSVTSSQR